MFLSISFAKFICKGNIRCEQELNTSGILITKIGKAFAAAVPSLLASVPFSGSSLRF